ncbi:hypothetical protein ACLMNJ_00375 [Streptomyces seoulensis]
MLTHTPADTPDPNRRPSPHRCRATAHLIAEVRWIPLGAADTTSPCSALHWLQERTRHITDQLDVAYTRPGRHWLTDEREHKRALACLTAGTGYTSARYVLVVSPPGATS